MYAIRSYYVSHISLSNFFGIEIDDFAHEIAMLALWLAEHQMNVEFKAHFGRTNPTLPLKQAGNIVCGNACRLDWEKVCPKGNDDEIYILGNPPYLGARLQKKCQKEDMEHVFKGIKGANNLDYIACWFKKGADYIKGNSAKFAFVTTNSISQGEQVAILWPCLFNKGLEIFFVHPSIKWTNSAKQNAGVTVSIVGVTKGPVKEKFIYSSNVKRKVKNINGYLIDSSNIFLFKRSKPISKLPIMNFGSMPNDGGNLLISEEEYNDYNLSLLPFVRKAIGAREFLHKLDRYCIWIVEDNDLWEKDNFILQRVNSVKKYRLKSTRMATKVLGETPYKFGEVRHKDTDFILVPRHSSENREYIPIGFFNQDNIALDSTLAIYDVEFYHFGILNSKIHQIWLRIVGGKLEERLRYSSSLVYNNFPFPPISDQRKQEITQCVFRILEEREKHPDKTLAQLYDPDKMPEGLREAHRLNDLVIERCYRSP